MSFLTRAVVVGAAMMAAAGVGADVRPRVACGAEDTSASPTRTLFEKEGQYHYVLVTQTGSVRRLQFRRRGSDYDESAINVSDPLDFELGYYALMFAGFAHQPNPKNVLFVGMGGGTLPMAIRYYYPEAHIDNVELDPDVVDVARRFFGLVEDERMRVFVADGRPQVRRFVREKKQYDIVFLDAFRGGFIPYQLTTFEFFESVKQLLSPTGVVASNLQPGFESYHYHRRTLAATFRHQWSYGNGGNVIVVADPRAKVPSKEELAATAEQLQKRKQFRIDLPGILRDVTTDDFVRTGPILTDDYAPIDVLRGIPRR